MSSTYSKLSSFYADNISLSLYSWFGIFISCSRGTFPLTKYVRFNVIQAILLNIICSCMGSIFCFFTNCFTRKSFWTRFSKFSISWTIILIAYSSLLIIYGRYPKIPVISEAARLTSTTRLKVNFLLLIKKVPCNFIRWEPFF